MLHVQEYLKTHTMLQLEEEHGVYSSVKEGIPSYKFSLNYDQIEAKANDFTSQCRGLILTTRDGHTISSKDTIVGETDVLAYPMHRFFNEGDGNAYKIDYEDPETCFLEKLDGTCCILYFDKFQNAWHVGTRGVPEANLPLDNFTNLTFRGLFEKALTETCGLSFDSFVSPLITSWTYCFELTAPENRVVVDYKVRRVTLLAIRDNITGQEQELPVSENGVPSVQSYSLGSLEELVKFVNEQSPTAHEGIVAVDKNFNRTKIKNAGYVAYNRARDIVGKSPRALLELILLEKLDDVMVMLPEHLQEHAKGMQEKVRVLFHSIEQDYVHCKHVADTDTLYNNPRKAFALEAQNKNMWLAPLINRFTGKCETFHDYVNQHKDSTGSIASGLLDKILGELDGV